MHIDNENVHPFDGSTSKINAKRIFGLQKHGRFQLLHISTKSFETQKRCTTFSKRKAGLMKKSHELATLTGSQVEYLFVFTFFNVSKYRK